MKTVKFLTAIVALAAISFSCSKDDATPTPLPVYPTENPLTGFLTASGFNQTTTNQVNNGDYEFGYSFIPQVTGKITAVVVKIPDAHANLRVTFWDKTAGTIVRTETLDIATAGVEVTKDITALNLVKDKEYFITFNSNDWYNHKKSDNSAVTYPFTVGNIKITSYSFISGTTQAMPTSPQTTYYAGDLSFKFQRTL